MTTPDRAASAARSDLTSSSIPDQLPLAMLLAVLLVPGNHRLRSPPRPTFEDASDSPLTVNNIAAARADSPAVASTHSTHYLAEPSSQRAREDSDGQPKPLARH
jgi:hypothetical protein